MSLLKNEKKKTQIVFEGTGMGKGVRSLSSFTGQNNGI